MSRRRFCSKDPHSLRSLAILSAPPMGLAAGFASTIDRCQPTSLAYRAAFAGVGETSPTQKWFRAFIKTQSRHVVLPFVKKLLPANIQCLDSSISLRLCSEARPSSQSPVVRSERSKTDKLSRFAFATTCRFTKFCTRTCAKLCRSAYERLLGLPLIQV